MKIDTDKIVKLLNEILDHQVSNRGSVNAFYTCYTYNGGDFPPWVKKAEKQIRALTTNKEVNKP